MVVQFWSTPLKPDRVLHALPQRLPQLNLEDESLIADFGPLFPWGFESRINDYMVYPEDFFPIFRKILDDLIPLWCFFLPLDPTPWRGDVVCYDSLEGGDGPGTRLREEFLEDVNSLLPGIQVVTKPLPTEMAQVSALSLLEPQAASEFSALETYQQEYYRDACEVLDRIGRLLNGPLRGYDERQELEQSMDELSARLTTMRRDWEVFQQGSAEIWYSDAATLIQESRFFSIHAIFDLVSQRFQEYLRFRKFRRR